jgi:hypothetical protein
MIRRRWPLGLPPGSLVPRTAEYVTLRRPAWSSLRPQSWQLRVESLGDRSLPGSPIAPDGNGRRNYDREMRDLYQEQLASL